MKIIQIYKKIINIKKSVDIKDFTMLLGLLMTGKGLYLVYKPSMWICIGIFLIYLALPKRVVKNGNSK